MGHLCPRRRWIQSGCGNQGVPWTGSGIGTCEGYLWPKPMFCGCVSGKCTWFSH